MTDLDIIKKIEKELKVKLKRLDKIESESQGYILKSDGQIIGLGLSKCEINNLNRIISPLSALTNLTLLDLSDNQLRNISPLSKLTNLTTLYLYHNQTSDISPLYALTNLTELGLSGNQLTDISSLSALTNLTTLNLMSNQASDISPLSVLTNLTTLYLYHNQLRDISPLSTLTNLTQLDSSNNQLSDISPLSALTNLKTLNLSLNQLKDISPLSALTNLTMLNLYHNQLRDISPLSALTNLTQLDSSNNQLRDISPLFVLTNLTLLDVSENSIEELPSWITNFFEGNRYIAFSNNPLKTPPPEIISQGKEAIINYFKQLEEQKEDYLFEAKLLIVGEAGAGKTSMACKMRDADCALPNEDDTTRGIEVQQYYFPLQKADFKGFTHPEKLENRNFRLNLWDFGGQEIYKATHRFFLSKRSLYALVADSRKEDTDFNYWLHIVEMFGGESPLLIVLNEKYQRRRNLDIPAMRKRFANIKEVIEVDFAESDKTRLHQLKKAIRYYVSSLPHIGSPVPARWTAVRESLEKDERNVISLQDYLNICKNNGIAKQEDARVLSQYFHDIGVFLHFQDDDLLERTLFLKPNWATHAVYKVLDHPLLNQKNGRFGKEDAETFWPEEEYSFVRKELLRLMKKFFLSYEIDYSGKYIVPERLPSVQPVYDWDKKDNLRVQYKYDYFMPRGILSQFIVEMHRYIRDHGLVWKRGVILERENSKAEVIESYDARAIHIRIAGKNKRDFMTLITEKFDRINAQYEKMIWEKLIPCNCTECKTKEEPHFYEHKDLKRRIEKGRDKVECGISYEMVNVKRLIDDVFRKQAGIRNSVDGMTDSVEKKKVFISYAREDYETAQRLFDDLTQEGFECWLDKEKLLGGHGWEREIQHNINKSNNALLLISEHSVSKIGYIQVEQKSLIHFMKFFPPDKRPLILVRLDKTEPLYEEFKALQRIDLFTSYEDGLEQILRSLKSEDNKKK